MSKLVRRTKRLSDADLQDMVDFAMAIMQKKIPVASSIAKVIIRNRRDFRHFVNPAYSLKSKRKFLKQKGGGIAGTLKKIARTVSRTTPENVQMTSFRRLEETPSTPALFASTPIRHRPAPSLTGPLAETSFRALAPESLRPLAPVVGHVAEAIGHRVGPIIRRTVRDRLRRVRQTPHLRYVTQRAPARENPYALRSYGPAPAPLQDPWVRTRGTIRPEVEEILERSAARRRALEETLERSQASRASRLAGEAAVERSHVSFAEPLATPSRYESLGPRSPFVTAYEEIRAQPSRYEVLGSEASFRAPYDPLKYSVLEEVATPIKTKPTRPPPPSPHDYASMRSRLDITPSRTELDITPSRVPELDVTPSRASFSTGSSQTPLIRGGVRRTALGSVGRYMARKIPGFLAAGVIGGVTGHYIGSRGAQRTQEISKIPATPQKEQARINERVKVDQYVPPIKKKKHPFDDVVGNPYARTRWYD